MKFIKLHSLSNQSTLYHVNINHIKAYYDVESKILSEAGTQVHLNDWSIIVKESAEYITSQIQYSSGSVK